ncbi:hypothetical protein [Halorubrum ezzemoulense]|uniref:hypothetical protein n=1 Tax=Halorubrum ezzemoulense TaxID=337243 RepID=UPI00232BBBE6|nr:hypothetical protein [Halorubrum ezzemoulense]MDB2242403.1 hypothetical protein [Halorubrum ezzemoulense]
MSTEEMPDDISGPDADTPITKLNAAYGTFEQDVKSADNAGEAMRLCLDAAEGFAEIEVEAGDAAGDQINSMARAYLNQLADTKSGVDRKSVRRVWSDKRDELEKERQISDGEAVIFPELVERTLRSVTKKVTTDRSSTEETEYVLKFDDSNGTQLTVTQSTLFEGRAMWKAYTAAQEGEYPDRIGNEELEWDNWVGGVLEDVGEDVEEEPGARTAALQALKNHVMNSTAFGNRMDAVEHGGVFVNAEPPDNTEVVVPREAIASITNTHEITDRALQAEISARGLTGPSTAGDKVAVSTTVHGNWQTFWYLSGDAFEVNEDSYKQEAEDPLDRMGPAPGDEDDDDDDDKVVNESDNVGDDSNTDTDDGSDQSGASPDSNDGDGGDNDDDGDKVVSESDDVRDDSNTDTDDGSEEDRSPGKIGSYGGEDGGDA